MTREQVVETLARLKIRVIKSDAYGIEIERTGSEPLPWPNWNMQRWRVEPCSGIGRPGQFSVQRLGVLQAGDVGRIGPYTTLRSLEKAIRAWRRWDLP